MPARAQTNLQLFAELQTAGCPPAELRRVRDAYLLSMRLYSGLYTECGRPTVAHEIGTASLALRYGASWDQVVAAVLHGAYVVGDWGHFRMRITARKRAQLRAVIGAASEAVVYEFWRQDWRGGALAELAARAPELDAVERDVAFLRLVEDLDRLSDDGALLGFRDPEWMRAYFQAARPAFQTVTAHFGWSELGADLDEAVARTLAADPPADLMHLPFPGEPGQRITSWSYRRKLTLRIYQFIAGQGRRAERELRDWVAPGSRHPSPRA